jgi:phosphoribosyl-AMP cyclohydrolase
MSSDWLDQINWNPEGLVPAIAQDWENGRVLMQAWVNREALALAVAEKRAIYWSRSRQKLWRKGEDSGHVQTLHGLYLDCDRDSIIYQVEQLGGIACHTGRQSCYFLKLVNGQWQENESVLKDPKDIYGDLPGITELT